MVDQSELAFRMFCRSNGCRLAYSPMLYANVVVRHAAGNEDSYLGDFFKTCKSDRPLAIQLGGNDADTLAKAAAIVAKKCDIVDLNLGCPQAMVKYESGFCCLLFAGAYSASGAGGSFVMFYLVRINL